MKTNITIIAIVSLFVLGTLNSNVSAKENSKTTIYRNVEKNNETGEKIISLYTGKNDRHPAPLRRHVISYSANNLPNKKVVYNWDLSKNTWIESNRYEYFYYVNTSPQVIIYSEWNDNTNDWGDKTAYANFLSNVGDELLTVNE